MLARLATTLLMAAIASAAPANADEITLRVKGGGLEVKGELKSFDGVRYVIEAPSFGAMTFDASRVECIGESCQKRVQPAQPTEKLDPASPDTVVIRAAGPVALELLPALVEGYAKSIEATVTQVVGASTEETKLRLEDASGKALATYVLRSADGASGEPAALAVTDRPADEASLQRWLGAGPAREARQEIAVAQDGLAFVVAPESPLVSVSEEKLAKVMAGRITTWVELGVSGGKINVYTVDAPSSATDVAVAALLKPRGLTLSDQVTRVASEAALADAVTRDASGIGITSFATVRNAKRLNIEGSCGLITRPTGFAVKAGEYPLSRRLSLLAGAGPLAPAARGLMRYASSAEAQRVLAEVQFIDQSVEMLSVDDQKGRMGYAINAPAQSFDLSAMRELLAEIKGMRRLSVTFRFVPGSPDLDGRSRREVQRLAGLLAGADYSGKRVLLLGFTDIEGKLHVNQSVSAKRAGQVRTAVLAAAAGRVNPATVTARGFGPLAPVACSDNSERRNLNRRVEVWVAE